MNFSGGISLPNTASSLLGGASLSSLTSQVAQLKQQVDQQVSMLAGSVMQQLIGQIQQSLAQAQQLAQQLGGGQSGAGGLPGAGGDAGGAGDVGGDGALGGIGGAGVGGAADSTGMTPQSAAGALSSYMSQNGVDPITPNQLYQLAQNPPAGTPPDVSKAAQFMLQNPDVFKAIETHDVPGADGKAGIGDMQWAAQGGADGTQGSQAPTMSDGSPVTMQSAAGAIAAYGQQNGVGTTDPNSLYQLAMNPPAGTPPDVQSAAKFMLQNPSAYQAIETADVKGADGLSSMANFQKAAQGGIADPTAGASPTATASDSSFIGGFSPQIMMSMMGMGGMGSLQMPKQQDDDDNA
ncbi:hypothetical protein [Burkholderia gladioli]|uniref:hypothetical protein n=1 Tax=Burkholderia gladioli TaxID=28095 RepID=UPI000BF229F2|nr:hypothetical protein [Burkholderia gladioli]PEH81504.1 hypothetical protein CRM95_25465 [Burkholderia gladioli]